MNQIMNVAGFGTSSCQQASLCKPMVGRASQASHAIHASRRTEGSTFRIPRGASTNPASAGAHGAGASHETRAIRSGSNGASGSGNSNSGSSRGGQHGKPTPRNGREPGNGNGGKKRIALAVLLVAALTLAGIGAWQCSKPASIDEATGGWFYDQDSTAIQEAIDHEVEDGYFNMSINTSVPVSEGVALIGIKNIPDNKFDCTVTVTLEDGTVVYQSGGLTPGSEIKHVTLNQDLPAGDHAATALFEIYEQDEAHTKVGQTASKLTFHVK